MTLPPMPRCCRRRGARFAPGRSAAHCSSHCARRKPRRAAAASTGAASRGPLPVSYAEDLGAAARMVSARRRGRCGPLVTAAGGQLVVARPVVAAYAGGSRDSLAALLHEPALLARARHPQVTRLARGSWQVGRRCTATWWTAASAQARPRVFRASRQRGCWLGGTRVLEHTAPSCVIVMFARRLVSFQYR
jgi:hypothetical protein